MDFKVIISILAAIVAVYFLAKLIVNKIPRKFFPLISLVLLIISGFLAYKIYDSIDSEIKFNKQKTIKFQNAIEGLKLIRDAEATYKQVNGVYSNDFNQLISFIENGKIPLLSVREITEQVNVRGVMQTIESKKTDTIGYRNVIEDFKGRDYKNMMYVPGTQIKYDLKTSSIEKGTTTKYQASTFEAKVNKRDLLKGLNQDYINREVAIKGIAEINGEFIVVGSLEEVKESGNWPTIYDRKKITD